MLYVALGRREMGKTTLAAYLIRDAAARVIFDPRGLFPAASRVRDAAGLAVAFDRLAETGAGEIVVTPDDDVQLLFDKTAAEVQAWLSDAPDRSIAFLVDEARFMELHKSKPFNWIVRCVTKANAMIVITCHRPADISPSLRGILDVWLMFQMTQEHDLQVIRERCSDSIADAVVTLQPFQFIAWDDAHSKATTYKNPKAWHIQLRATPATIAPHRADPLANADGTELLPARVDGHLPL